MAKEPPLDIESLDFTRGSDSFAVHGQALRCGGKIRHDWKFESLPDHEVLLSERLVAVRQVTLHRAETGTLRQPGTDQKVGFPAYTLCKGLMIFTS